MRNLLMSAIILACSSALAPAVALNDEERQQIDKQIEDFFMRNPEKLERALDNMQFYLAQRAEQQRAQALLANADNLYRNPSDYSMGPKNAPITIVEFFDYNCGYCKRSFNPLMQVLDENKDVRIVFKEYPILGEASYIAASAALALNDKMKYLTYHSKLMTSQGRLSQAVVEKTLSDLRLPVKKVQSDALNEKYVMHLASTRQLAEAIGVSGTPAFVINGKLFPGALDKTELAEAIKVARIDLKTK